MESGARELVFGRRKWSLENRSLRPQIYFHTQDRCIFHLSMRYFPCPESTLKEAILCIEEHLSLEKFLLSTSSEKTGTKCEEEVCQVKIFLCPPMQNFLPERDELERQEKSLCKHFDGRFSRNFV